MNLLLSKSATNNNDGNASLHQVEAAEKALEAAKRDLQSARQALERQKTNRAATAPAASLLLVNGVQEGDVCAFYDSATAAVIQKQDTILPTFHLHGTSGDSTPCTDSTCSRNHHPNCTEEEDEDPGFLEFLAFLNESSDDDKEEEKLEVEDDPGYLEFLSFINADDPAPPNIPNVNDPEKEVIDSGKKTPIYEDVELTQKRVPVSTLRNTLDLFQIPEDASIQPSDVSSIADASASVRTETSLPFLCKNVVVHASSPDAIRVIEGVYHKFDNKDGVHCYCKIGTYEEKETIFSIGRWKVNNGLKKWYITGIHQERKSKQDKKMAFYYAYSNEDMPPADGWMECTAGRELFLWPAFIAKASLRGSSSEYESPISIEREWRRSSHRSFFGKVY